MNCKFWAFWEEGRKALREENLEEDSKEEAKKKSNCEPAQCLQNKIKAISTVEGRKEGRS